MVRTSIYTFFLSSPDQLKSIRILFDRTTAFVGGIQGYIFMLTYHFDLMPKQMKGSMYFNAKPLLCVNGIVMAEVFNCKTLKPLK